MWNTCERLMTVSKFLPNWAKYMWCEFWCKAWVVSGSTSNFDAFLRTWHQCTCHLSWQKFTWFFIISNLKLWQEIEQISLKWASNGFKFPVFLFFIIIFSNHVSYWFWDPMWCSAKLFYYLYINYKKQIFQHVKHC